MSTQYYVDGQTNDGASIGGSTNAAMRLIARDQPAPPHGVPIS
jgi:hypothetical protein